MCKFRYQIFLPFVHYTASGKISDFSDSGPLEMVKLRFGKTATYTNWQGYYEFWEPQKDKYVEIETPSQFETYQNPLESKAAFQGLFGAKIESSASLVPTLQETARRVVMAEVKPPSGKADLEGNYKRIWLYAVPESKDLWKDINEFTETFFVYNLILKKLGRELVEVKVDEGVVSLDRWVDPLSGKEFREVKEISVTRTFADGREEIVKEHLVRVGGFWHVILHFNRGETWKFNKENEWVLKEKS